MAERTYTMRWLTLDDIKDQLRIEQEDTSQDKLLTRYGATAENFTLGYLQRSEAELKVAKREAFSRPDTGAGGHRERVPDFGGCLLSASRPYLPAEHVPH